MVVVVCVVERTPTLRSFTFLPPSVHLFREATLPFVVLVIRLLFHHPTYLIPRTLVLGCPPIGVEQTRDRDEWTTIAHPTTTCRRDSIWIADDVLKRKIRHPCGGQVHQRRSDAGTAETSGHVQGKDQTRNPCCSWCRNTCCIGPITSCSTACRSSPCTSAYRR